MILKHLTIGGIYFMLPIYIMWIIVIFFTIRFLLNYYSEKRSLKKIEQYNSIIIFAGSFAFMIGIFGQINGFYQVLDVIEREGDIAPCLIAGGLKVTLLTVLYGFGALLLSAIVWFVFKTLINKHIN